MAEKEYIERGAVISCILSVNHNLAGVIQHINEHVPAADVVEIVRCRDCKYYKASPLYPKGQRKFCYKVLKSNGLAVGHGFTEFDFCSYGERKEQK